METFYLIAPPGLEPTVAHELERWLQAFGQTVPTGDTSLRYQIEKGGINIELPLDLGLELNRYLKTPSRILLRLADFRCRDFPKLFKKIRGLDWSPWISREAVEPEFRVSSHGSRLAIKKRIEETCRDGYRASLARRSTGEKANRARPAKSANPPEIFVRFIDDVCTISIDTSGEHLHRRGIRTHTPEAPLRETLAASLLNILFAAHESLEHKWSLLDPMVGSGTFLIEALSLERKATREFAFESFPYAMEKKCELVPAPVASPGFLRIERVRGWDVDAKSLAATRANLEFLHQARKAAGEKSDFAKVSIEEHDAFSEKAPSQELIQESGWCAVICNPPYGERLKIEGPLWAYYSRLFAAVEAKARPLRAGFVLPAPVRSDAMPLPKEWRRESQTRFENGGIPVVFHVFSRK